MVRFLIHAVTRHQPERASEGVSRVPPRWRVRVSGKHAQSFTADRRSPDSEKSHDWLFRHGQETRAEQPSPTIQLF